MLPGQPAQEKSLVVVRTHYPGERLAYGIDKKILDILFQHIVFP
jgi:hypothetical protein